jgi:hypothetical protein
VDQQWRDTIDKMLAESARLRVECEKAQHMLMETAGKYERLYAEYRRAKMRFAALQSWMEAEGKSSHPPHLCNNSDNSSHQNMLD